jgi:hypothetical protein
MMNQDCKAHRAEIEESAGSPAQSPGLRSHLAACRACEHFQRERASLRELVGGLEKVTAPVDFEFRLRARLAAAEGARRPHPFRLSFVPGVVSVALATCFLIFSASIYLRRESATNQPEVQESASNVSAPSVPERVHGNATAAKDAANDTNVEQNLEVAATTPQRNPKPRHASNIRAALYDKAQGRTARGEGRFATFDSRQAPILSAPASASREQGSSRTDAAAVAVRTPAVPLQVVLRDERGAARLVSMRSVSFGAQDLVRQGSNVVPASYKDKEGVW